LPALSVGASAQWASAHRGDYALGASAWHAQLGLGWRSSRTDESAPSADDPRDARQRLSYADPPCVVSEACAWAWQAERDALVAGGL